MRILRRPEVEKITGLSTSALYAKLRFNPKRPKEFDATFPAPIAIGVRAVGWVESEVLAWVDEQVARRAEREAMLGRAPRRHSEHREAA